MNVTDNAKVRSWVLAQSARGLKNKYNVHCAEAANNDLTSWRNVGKGNYDFRASGNNRIVAHKSGNNFYVSAVYKHGTNGGKTLVTGVAVAGY